MPFHLCPDKAVYSVVLIWSNILWCDVDMSSDDKMNCYELQLNLKHTLRESTAVFSSSSSLVLCWHFCLISAWDTPRSFCPWNKRKLSLYWQIKLENKDFVIDWHLHDNSVNVQLYNTTFPLMTQIFMYGNSMLRFFLEFEEPASHGWLYVQKERGMLITPGM